MFKDNKYTIWYYRIIDNAKTRAIDGYIERHHIIPKSLGGSNKKENLVKLTAREHFICHLLLTKMHDSNKMKFALVMMMTQNDNQKEKRYVPNSRTYEYIKRLNSELASEKFKGKQKHNVGKKHAYNPVTKKSGRFFIADIPDGWILGLSPTHIENLKGVHSGKIYYNNPSTKEIISLASDVLPPEGFIKGNPNATTRSALDTTMYFNQVSGHRKRFKNNDPIPNGWIKGSNKSWVNNGITNKQVLKENIPEGFELGRLTKPSKIYRTPLGDFNFKHEIVSSSVLSGHLTALIFNNLDSLPSKRAVHILSKFTIDAKKTWRENGFNFIKE